jgi:RNA polymerase sigma factor (sigma-70 family)
MQNPPDSETNFVDNRKASCNYPCVQDELTLISQAKNGDMEAFKKLFDANIRIYVSCVSQLSQRNPSLAEELLEAKESRMFEAINDFEEGRGSKFSTYLHNKLRWEFLNRDKAEKVRSCLHLEDCTTDNGEWIIKDSAILDNGPLGGFSITGHAGDNPCEQTAKIELLQKISEHLENEDERTKMIVTLRYTKKPDGHFYTLQDIADVVQLSHQGVKNVHDRFVERMRSIYDTN